MKTALFVLGFLGAGLVGAVASRELFPPAASPAADAPGDLAGLEARVDDLSDQVARLSEEVRARRDAGIVPSDPSHAAAADDPTLLPGLAADPAGAPPAFTDDRIEKKIEETIAKITRERQAEKAKQVELSTRKKEREWLLTKQKEHGLTDYQVEEFTKLLMYRRERLGTLKAGWNEATPEQQAQRKTEMEDLGRELRGELQKLLSGDQYEAIMKTNGRK